MKIFKSFFSFYGQYFRERCSCLISDNTSTNVKVNRIYKKPFVDFNSLLLNLQVNAMLSGQDDLNRDFEVDQETMKDAKQFKILQYFDIAPIRVLFCITKRVAQASSMLWSDLIISGKQ